jgi:hypothetical protein
MTRTLSSPRGPRFHGHRPIRGTRFLGDVVRRIRATLPGPSAQDHQLLSDISRERYSTTWVARLIDLAARCEAEDAAFALPDAIAAEIAARRPAPAGDLLDLARVETETQSLADIAVTAALVQRTATGAEVAMEALDAHIHAAAQLRARLAHEARR